MNNTRQGRRYHAWLTLCAAAISVLALAANPAPAQCQYEVTAIIEGPPCWPSNFPAVLTGRGMNSCGHVVGSWQMCFEAADEAFYWTPETGLVTITRPAGVTSAIASDINDHGQIVGGHQVNGVGWKGFVYDIKTQHYTYLEPLHAWPVPLHILSSLNAINNAGIAVGSRTISKPGVSPTVSNAVIWDTNTGEVIDLGVMNGRNSTAVAINRNGAVAGTTGPSLESEGWLYSNRELQLLGSIPGGLSSSVAAISDGDGIAGGGVYWRSGSWRSYAALWHDSAWTILPMTKNAIGGGALAINNIGQVAGRLIYPDTVWQAVLWQHGEVHHFVDLVKDLPGDAQLELPRGANDAGQFLVRGGTKAYVLSPIDRPLTDLNADCRTDVDDLLMLLDAWSSHTKRSADAPADFNADGVVDVSDLLILLANWGLPCDSDSAAAGPGRCGFGVVGWTRDCAALRRGLNHLPSISSKP